MFDEIYPEDVVMVSVMIQVVMPNNKHIERNLALKPVNVIIRDH